jgi:hypothetical protein
MVNADTGVRLSATDLIPVFSNGILGVSESSYFLIDH